MKGKWLRPPTAKSFSSYAGRTAKRPTQQLNGIDRLYHQVAWLRFRESFLGLNPICQAIDLEGEQCHSAAKICHHLVSPYVDPTKFFNWHFVVGVCDGHHPYGPGEPLNANNRYVTTHGLFGASVEPNEIIAYLKGGGR